MKSASSHCQWRLHFLANTSSLYFYLTCLTLILLLCSQLLYYPRNASHTISTQGYSGNNTFVPARKDRESCNLFKGQWIRDAADPLYTNYSCKVLPFLKNCFLNGRRDTDFLHWRWKPDECELPRFSSEKFFTALQGKTMAFIGDSVARNQMESLLCLLSTVETPIRTFKDSEDRFRIWKFPKNNFTVMSFWSQFLVTSIARVVNGSATSSFDLYLDKIDTPWAEKLPLMDYAIFSGAHWFFRENYLFEGGKLIGCIYCQRPNVTDLGPGFAIGKAFRAAFEAINNCKDCRKIFALLRTYSPSHFENGTWNNGGGCDRRWPVGREEVNKDRPDWDYRRIQMEEISEARKRGEGSRKGFEVLDVTEMMLTRADGHPGSYWGNKWMKGYNDCIHWCMPGAIDVWNELLFELIKRRNMLSEAAQ